MDAMSTQIASRKFDIVRRGYESGAVDSYLAKIGDQFGKLEDSLRVARSKIEDLERRTRDLDTADTVVRTTFLAAAEAKAKLIAEAEEKARDIIASAESRAASMSAVNSSGEAESVLLEARRRLEESERHALALRTEAEREAAAIVASAKARVSDDGTRSMGGDATAAADELSRLVETLGSLKEASGQGLDQAVSLAADIELVVGEH
jgi:cell division septum initiation protein DivIVA